MCLHVRRVRFLRWCALALLFAAVPLMAGENAMPDQFKALLTQSQEEKFGITFYVNGQTIAALVTGFDDQIIEGRSQAHDRILIRVDQVDAMAR
jgi:hypothetical protein